MEGDTILNRKMWLQNKPRSSGVIPSLGGYIKPGDGRIGQLFSLRAPRLGEQLNRYVLEVMSLDDENLQSVEIYYHLRQVGSREVRTMGIRELNTNYSLIPGASGFVRDLK